MQTDIQMLIAILRAPTEGEVIKVLQLLVLGDFVLKIPLYLGSQLAKTAVAPVYESVRWVILIFCVCYIFISHAIRSCLSPVIILPDVVKYSSRVQLNLFFKLSCIFRLGYDYYWTAFTCVIYDIGQHLWCFERDHHAYTYCNHLDYFGFS